MFRPLSRFREVKKGTQTYYDKKADIFTTDGSTEHSSVPVRDVLESEART